ncbi:hypothetical protein EB20_00011 [Enterococcus hirae]|nr:hypothetical protein EB10_02576 [Enterococcus hirae]RBT51201.1 hypothetical protein EB20_00011 [Enterococcus hirae]RBT51416.1 hypothetical protein EB24_02937 [Enterococcus hirae]RBT57537.1 hypothetical protein EB39_02924 [Enterococcus hirae]RBT57953.1 hypothetical protein EB45_02546 [Enterococcus hirae]
MSKWNVVLSTTEPYNYVGMIQVRQGNKNTEVMEATIVENGLPYDLSECKVYFESVVGGKYPVQLETKIVDAKKGKINYIFDKYSMQCLHRQTANFIIFKGEDLIGTTQDFSYFVINAVSKTEGEMGSYWQSIEDLIADMTDFINENKGDFTDWMNERKEEFERWRQEQEHSFQDWREGQKSDYLAWFESIKDILKTIDPGGTMLAELMDARVDIQGKRHNSISERLLADMNYLYQKLRTSLFTIEYAEIEVVDILQDDLFSRNHEIEKVESIENNISEGALIVATIDDKEQRVFTLEEVVIDKILTINPYIAGKTDWITGTCKVFDATKIGIEINGKKKDIVPSNELKNGTFKYYTGKTIQLGDQVQVVLYDNMTIELTRKSVVVQEEGESIGEG